MIAYVYDAAYILFLLAGYTAVVMSLVALVGASIAVVLRILTK